MMDLMALPLSAERSRSVQKNDPLLASQECSVRLSLSGTMLSGPSRQEVELTNGDSRVWHWKCGGLAALWLLKFHRYMCNVISQFIKQMTLEWLIQHFHTHNFNIKDMLNLQIITISSINFNIYKYKKYLCTHIFIYLIKIKNMFGNAVHKTFYFKIWSISGWNRIFS